MRLANELFDAVDVGLLAKALVKLDAVVVVVVVVVAQVKRHELLQVFDEHTGVLKNGRAGIDRLRGVNHRSVVYLLILYLNLIK